MWARASRSPSTSLGQEVALDELAEAAADLVLAVGDDRGVRDRQAERVAEQGGDREPVGERADHRRLGEGPHVPDPAVTTVDRRDDIDHGREQEHRQRECLHAAQAAPLLEIRERSHAGRSDLRPAADVGTLGACALELPEAVESDQRRHGVPDLQRFLGGGQPAGEDKSGRPLEAELARMGYALVPAEPPNMIFADGAELTLPTDRGGQYATLADAYGRQVAERWQQLLDHLGEVWQTLRGLGVEAELRGRRQLDRATIQSLLGRKATLAGLAASIGHPHLEALIRSVAYRSGSVPECTPAFVAVELYLPVRSGAGRSNPLTSIPHSMWADPRSRRSAGSAP